MMIDSRSTPMLIVRFWRKIRGEAHIWQSAGIAHKGDSWTWGLAMIPTDRPVFIRAQQNGTTYVDVELAQ